MTSSLSPAPLTIELMRVESTSGNEGAVVALMERLLRQNGWRVERIPVSEGRDALLATWSDRIDVTLSTHLDTVPPYIAPSQDGEVIRGRGACDAKGIAASMICAAHRLRERGVNVALLFVVGEETAHDGAHAANRRATTSRVLINGEPTENTLAVGTKGAMRIIVRSRGKAAHSAYPHLGQSAIEALVERLAAISGMTLPSDTLLGATTVNVGTVSGGVADNVVAPWAEARLMVRLVSDEDEVFELFKAWAGDKLAIEKGVTIQAVRLGVIPGFETSVAAYATDIPALSNWGTPFLYGPGSIHVAHTMDEYVRIAELDRAVLDYERIAVAALELQP